LKLRATGEHFVVGRRSELTQLFVQLILNMAGVLDDPDESARTGARSSADLRVEGAPASGARGGEPPRRGQEGTGARASSTRSGRRRLRFGVARQIVVAHEGHIELGPKAAAPGARCSACSPPPRETDAAPRER